MQGRTHADGYDYPHAAAYGYYGHL
jgi:hypothetical protein